MHKDSRWCRICKPRNRTIYFHTDSETGKMWLWCNKCSKGYSLERYSRLTGLSIEEILTNAVIEEARPNEVNAVAWPSKFIPLSDPRSAKGVEYIKSRGLTLDGDFYYDMENEGIVFPYYFGNTFCGAQIRFIEPRETEDGKEWKVTTMHGTRLGLLIYGYAQEKLMPNVKGIIITEGAFNCIAIQQALNIGYGGVSNNPWHVVACSGSGGSSHHMEIFKEFKEKGYKVVCAADTDEAGLEMANKYIEHGAVTHTAFTGETTKDWNDKLKELGHREFAKFFISCINPI